MAALDFSSIKGCNPLTSPGGDVIAVNRQIKFTNAVQETNQEAVDIQRDAYAHRVQNIRDFERQMKGLLDTLATPARLVSEANTMNQTILERDRVIRAHRKGGDALYAAVEELMAAPPV